MRMKCMCYALKHNLLGIFIHRRAVSYKIRNEIDIIMNNLKHSSETEFSPVLYERNRYSNKFSLGILGNGTCGRNSLHVNTDYGQYLFNCGEGMQRLSCEYGMKLSKLCAVFITSHSWRNMGGFTGLFLTNQSWGTRELVVYGPPEIREIIFKSKTFVFLRGISVKVITDIPNNIFDDGKMKVQFVPLYEESSKSDKATSFNRKIISQDNDIDKTESELNGSVNTSQLKVKKMQQTDLYTLCYICETPEYGGCINHEECIKRGVPNGPLLGKLQCKCDVYLDDGTLIKWQDVFLSPAKNSYFLVIDCPSEKYLKALIENNEFSDYQSSGSKVPFAIVHFTPPEVMNTKRYMEWMGRFPAETTHLRVNSDNISMDLIEVHRLQTKLNIIHPEIFPLLKESLPQIKMEYLDRNSKADLTIFTCIDKEREMEIYNNLKQGRKLELPASEVLEAETELDLYENISGMNVIKAINSVSIKLHPSPGYDFTHQIAFNREFCAKEILEMENMREELENLANAEKAWKSSETYKRASEYPKIWFMGTSSAAPHKSRCSSALLIEINKDSMVLFDCGEGTYRQLLRLFGYDYVGEIFKKLKLIFVSHQHADHHIGLINLLMERAKFLQHIQENNKNEKLNSLFVLLPIYVKFWVNSISKLYPEILYNTIIVDSEMAGRSSDFDKYLKPIGLCKLQLVSVPHCFRSYGITLTDTNGYKITYSGDCEPSTELIRAGIGSDLLIHEATFEDGLEKMARARKHSTISQAIGVGRKMKAKFVMLTHFSQRYSHYPSLEGELPANVSVAFDNMMVSPKHLAILPHLRKIYDILFAKKMELMMHKKMKRGCKAERAELEVPLKIKSIS